MVRLATWNIRHARRADGAGVDPAAFARACASLGADVLALQEVDRRTTRVQGADLLVLAADATGLTAVDGHVLAYGGGTYGNALLVRPDLLSGDGTVVTLPRAWWPPWRRPEPRGCVVADVAGVRIVATHLSQLRRERRRQLPAVLDAAGGGRAVVLGDLNARLAEVARHARGARFELVDVPPAHPAAAPRRAIDHVLVRGVTATPCPPLDQPPVSDHRPVIVDVQLEI